MFARHRNMKNPVSFLRIVGLTEGISFLLLVGMAMPLKHLAGFPMAVKVAGWIHGVLFMVFGLALLLTMVKARWPMLRGAGVFVAALLPFGPFVMDRRMRAYEAEFSER